MISSLPLLVLSNVIVDDVWEADGRHRGLNLGGAAVWAAVGAKFWLPAVGIVAGVGEDIDQVSGGWLRKHGLLPDGEIKRTANTIRSTLRYLPDGDRTETPAFGPEHFQNLQLIPADIPPSLRPAAATYIFRDLWPEFWDSYSEYRSQLGKTLWELQGDVAGAKYWSAIKTQLSNVDIFSLNLAEAECLLGAERTPQDLTSELIDAGAGIVVLRMGARGAMVASGNARLFVRPPNYKVGDVTGGGNAFCGGFLAGWTLNPGDLELAARTAAASAALCIGQYGLPDPAVSNVAVKLADACQVEWDSPVPLSEEKLHG
ncbi:carbohydrate kinase family protein [Ensifer sp. YR511]|uniref:carbohydrate kinase family protein n=1 Tax=Ensifer sp. YR511 TaxID=1855294 RepID=UPI00088DA00F|nr:carbohydrate kinase family protein [Ensifer sp. YR511]SDN79059.1 Sugar or nucleoside kinase, ribokinase family [Ensifer sp. YR511]